MVTNPLNNYITVTEASKILGVTPHYIRKLIKEGKILGQQNRENSRWLVDKVSLDQFKSTDIYRIDKEAKEIKITIQDAVDIVEYEFDTDIISYIILPNHANSYIESGDSLFLDDLLYSMQKPFKRGKKRKYKKITIFLHSTGGIIEGALKFISVVRQYSETVDVIVPIMAKSAATVIALLADNLYLTSISELGPVDPIVQSPTKPSFMVPATAIDNFIKYYREKKSEFDPLIKDKLNEYFDPYLIGAHKTALMFSREVIEDALQNHGLKGVTDEKLIKEVVNLFTEKYSSHGYPITFDKIEKYNICKKLDDPDKLKSIKTLLAVYTQYMRNSNIVKLIGNRNENKNIFLRENTPVQQLPTKTSV